MGNEASEQKASKSGKSGLPFFSREDDYSPLADNNEGDGFGKSFKCSLKTRVIVYAVCCSVGWFLSILGTLSLVINNDIVMFSVLYSIGQITNITGSCFLATPKKQFKDMAHPKRVVISAVYLLLILVTLLLGIFLPQSLSFLVFVSLVAQVIAYFFYTLSYIPFGKKILKKLCRFLVE